MIESSDFDMKFVEKDNLTRYQRQTHTLKKFKYFQWHKQFLGQYIRKLYLRTHTGFKLY